MDTNMIKREIHIKDTTFAHCEYSNNPLPPKHFSKSITWIRNEEPGKHDWCVYTDMTIARVRKDSDKNIAWLIEPRELIPGAYQWVEMNQHLFAQVWTHDDALVASIPHAHRVPFGGCWIDDEDMQIYPKTKNFSMIASCKNALTGHKLRHDIARNSAGKIDLFGGGYKDIPNKIDGLKDYRYHFAIENSRANYWFTEKLIDCFMTGTIPIYWGCPSISDYFNTDGMICFTELEDLPPLLKNCNEDNYLKALPAIQDNFERAKQFILAEDWIHTHINLP